MFPDLMLDHLACLLFFVIYNILVLTRMFIFLCVYFLNSWKRRTVYMRNLKLTTSMRFVWICKCYINIHRAFRSLIPNCEMKVLDIKLYLSLLYLIFWIHITAALYLLDYHMFKTVAILATLFFWPNQLFSTLWCSLHLIQTTF